MVDVRRIAPAPDLTIENLDELRGGFVCRSGHPLRQLDHPMSIDDIPRYPLASTPLSGEVAHMLVNTFGPRADPLQAVSLRCDEVTSLIETTKVTDAIYFGILAAALVGIAAGELAELVTAAQLTSGARFAFCHAGRTQRGAVNGSVPTVCGRAVARLRGKKAASAAQSGSGTGQSHSKPSRCKR